MPYFAWHFTLFACIVLSVAVTVERLVMAMLREFTTSLQNFKPVCPFSRWLVPTLHVHTSGKNSETWAEQLRENKMAEKIVNSTKI